MKHLENFNSFLNEAKIGDTVLSTDEMVDMLISGKNKLNPYTIAHLLIKKFYVLAGAVANCDNGREALMLVRHIKGAVDIFKRDAKETLVLPDNTSIKVANDDIMGAYNNLVSILFEEYPEMTKEGSEDHTWFREVNATSRKQVLATQINDAKAELARITSEMTASIRMMEEELKNVY